MYNSNPPRACLCCGKTVRGRSDKKFCDDFCRNSYNNNMYATHYNILRSINSILRKNRRVLEDLLCKEQNPIRLNREKLLQQGFHFGYHTHTTETKEGETVYYCYDYGYRPVSPNSFQLLRQAEY